MWGWNDDEFSLHEGINLDVPKSLWNDDVSQNEDLSYILDDITPIKACGDVGYHAVNNENTNNVKAAKPYSSQIKRRRMLQFESEVSEMPYCNEEMPPSFLKSKDGEDTLEEAFSNMSQLAGEDTSSSGYEGLEPSSEGWVVDCLNDTATRSKSNIVDLTGASYVQNAGFCNVPPEQEGNTVQKRRSRTRKDVVFKGKKSYMQAPAKVSSTVVYPFSFIKPCGMHGDMTLKDINQRILNPPKPKEDPCAAYPTSAFSGKPVVGKTKIHTEGGKGCITIMRTKG